MTHNPDDPDEHKRPEWLRGLPRDLLVTYQLTIPNKGISAGFISRGTAGHIVDAAPVLRWLVGKPFLAAERYAAKHGGKVRRVADECAGAPPRFRPDFPSAKGNTVDPSGLDLAATCPGCGCKRLAPLDPFEDNPTQRCGACGWEGLKA